MTTLREDGFESFLKRQCAVMNGVLVHGNDSAAIANFGRQLVRAVAGPNGEADRYEATFLKEGAGRIEDEFFSLSLLGDRRVIWIDDVTDAHLKILAGILGSDKVGNFIFLSADSLVKLSKLRVACEQSAKFASFALYDEGIEGIRSRLSGLVAKFNMTWGDGAEDIFVEVVGAERSIVSQEIEKLVVYCFGQTAITVEDVLAICGDTASSSSDGVINAMLSGDLEAVDRMLGNIDTDSGGLKTILQTTSLHLTRLQDFRAAMDGGASADTAVRSARPPIFFKRQAKVLAQLRKFDSSDLMSMQSALSASTFQTRKFADLADSIISRTLLSLARLARSKSTELRG